MVGFWKDPVNVKEPHAKVDRAVPVPAFRGLHEHELHPYGLRTFPASLARPLSSSRITASSIRPALHCIIINMFKMGSGT